jgi:hypothetical protein
MNFSYDWILEVDLNLELTEKIKKSVNKTIANDLKNDPGRTNGTSAVGDIIQYSLTENIDNFVLDTIKSITFEQLLKNDIINIQNKLTKTSIWTVIGQKGSYHIAHNHTKMVNKFIPHVSCVLYLETPPEKLFSGLFYTFFRTNEIIVKPPKIGKMLIFPVWMFHGTYPQEQGTRHTVNFSFEIL